MDRYGQFRNQGYLDNSSYVRVGDVLAHHCVGTSAHCSDGYPRLPGSPLPSSWTAKASAFREAEAGILSEDDRVELIEGELVEMTPIGSRHAACVKRLNQLLSQQVGQHALVSVQDPIRLGERSEPEPDLAVLRPRADFYASAHPGAEDALLIVEVAEASLDYDRAVKLPLYARFGIPEVWLVDLVGERIEVYRHPTPQGYQEAQRLRRGERASSQSVSGLELAVDEILG
jgi:Uma2 family endonuclease